MKIEMDGDKTTIVSESEKEHKILEDNWDLFKKILNENLFEPVNEVEESLNDLMDSLSQDSIDL